MALNIKALEHYAKLYLGKQFHDKESKRLGSEMEKIRQDLLDHLNDEGVDMVSLKGGRTVSVHPEIWPKYGHKERAIKALKLAGITDMVEEGFNHNRLAAFIRERLRSGKKLPKEFEGLIEADTVYKLKARKLL